MFLTYFAQLLSSYVAKPILNLEIISTVAASVRGKSGFQFCGLLMCARGWRGVQIRRPAFATAG